MTTDTTGRPASRSMVGGLATILIAAGYLVLPAAAHPADGAPPAHPADGARPAAPVARSADAPLAVGEAVRLALASSPAIRAAERALDAARAREAQAAVFPNPNLTIAAEELRLTDPAAGNYSVGVGQPLLLGGHREAKVQVAEAERIGAELDLAEQKRDVALSVRTALATLQFETAGERLALDQRDGAALMVALARKRLKVGDIPPVEVIRAETEVARAEALVALTQGKSAGALARLNALLGRPSEFPVALAGADSSLTLSLPPVQDLVARGQKARRDLQRLDAAIRRDEAQRRVAEAGVWTGSQVFVSGGLAGGSPAVSLGLTLPVPLYRQQAEILEAEAQKLRTEATREAEARAVAAQIEQAYRDAVQARRQIDLLRESVVPLARRLADNAMRRFEAGEGSGSEVQESGRSYREAEFELRKARFDHQRALAALERAVGEELRP